MDIRDLVTQIRRNHALEHATMHLLSHSIPPPRLVGRSDWSGFTLYGVVDTSAVAQAAVRALALLQQGEEGLALHPRCGTNLAVAGLLVSGGLYLGDWLPLRSRLAKGLVMAGAALAALRISIPISELVQRHVTTTPHLERVRVRAVQVQRIGQLTIHRILVAHDGPTGEYVLHPSW